MTHTAFRPCSSLAFFFHVMSWLCLHYWMMHFPPSLLPRGKLTGSASSFVSHCHFSFGQRDRRPVFSFFRLRQRCLLAGRGWWWGSDWEGGRGTLRVCESGVASRCCKWNFRSFLSDLADMFTDCLTTRVVVATRSARTWGDMYGCLPRSVPLSSPPSLGGLGGLRLKLTPARLAVFRRHTLGAIEEAQDKPSALCQLNSKRAWTSWLSPCSRVLLFYHDLPFFFCPPSPFFTPGEFISRKNENSRMENTCRLVFRNLY